MGIGIGLLILRSVFLVVFIFLTHFAFSFFFFCAGVCFTSTHRDPMMQVSLANHTSPFVLASVVTGGQFLSRSSFFFEGNQCSCCRDAKCAVQRKVDLKYKALS